MPATRPAVGVLLVHGMGRQDELEFGRDFIAAMPARLADRGVAPGAVAFRAGVWADVLNAREDALFRDAEDGGTLRWDGLRRFVVNALGDAVAYRRDDHPSDPAADRRPADGAYALIHARIHAHLRALREVLGHDAPLVVVAHSLGAVIVSDYVWNARRPGNRHGVGAAAAEGTPFERADTLAGLITLGTTIPLFALALPRVLAIAPPRESPLLAPAVRAVAVWHNYYDPDDVLGWPLRTLALDPTGAAPQVAGEWSYRDAVEADHAVAAGGALTGWTPFVHTAYWHDAGVLDAAADQIAAVARAAVAPTA